MEETNPAHLFDIKPIILNVEKLIQNGLNKLLINYIERHELLEKTHQQLIRLPSIIEELNKQNNNYCVNNSDNEIECEIKENNFSNSSTIRVITENIVNHKISHLEDKLINMEKKYDAIIPILDKLLGKIGDLNDDIKELQKDKTSIQNIVYSNNIEKSSVVKNSENENIKIHIVETTDIEETKELVINEASSYEDTEPTLITSSTIMLNHEREIFELDNIDNISIDQQFSVKEIKVQETNNEQDNEHNKELSNEEKVTIISDIKENPIEDLTEEELEDEKEIIEHETSIESESDESESNEVTEEITNEEASIETETKITELEDEYDEIFEIDIDDKTYCTNNDENGYIWELTEDGEQGEKVGYFKESEPFFYAENN